MKSFISLAEAAGQLAGEAANEADIEAWASLLEQQAEQLLVVKTSSTHRNAIPGGISFLLGRDQWQIPRAAFNAWCKANGMLAETQSSNIQAAFDTPEPPPQTSYRIPLFKRLEPVNPWRGGRITETDVLGLPEAAAMASKHAGQQVTIQDILRAAARGEIPLRAIVHCSAKTAPCKPGDLPMNDGKPVPQGSIPTLPISACQALANTGRAEWRIFEWFAEVPAGSGVDARFDRWQLAPGEPDFITTPDDCRVTGRDLHALADAFCASVEATTPEQLIKVGEPSRGPAWSVVRKLARQSGYRTPLHRLILEAHKLGRPRPNARDVIEAWQAQMPPEIAMVLPEGIDYYDAKGNTKSADLEAIRKAISRMTNGR